MQAEGVRSPQVLPELFGGQVLPHRPAKKPRGENGAEALPIFFFSGPQASTELFGPTGDGTATKTNRTAHAGGGKRSPQGSGTETVPPGATTRQRPSPRCSCA